MRDASGRMQLNSQKRLYAFSTFCAFSWTLKEARRRQPLRLVLFDLELPFDEN